MLLLGTIFLVFDLGMIRITLQLVELTRKFSSILLLKTALTSHTPIFFIIAGLFLSLLLEFFLSQEGSWCHCSYSLSLVTRVSECRILTRLSIAMNASMSHQGSFNTKYMSIHLSTMTHQVQFSLNKLTKVYISILPTVTKSQNYIYFQCSKFCVSMLLGPKYSQLI